jgi:iron complex outermembrane recepter protein
VPGPGRKWLLACVCELAYVGAAPATAAGVGAAADASAAGDALASEAGSGGGLLDSVVVTATRVPEPLRRIPAAISVVSGDELRARDATNLQQALALVTGVEAPPGGDAGPSSAVPSFWGLHEFDAFLLVLDGVPWGGAFNPAITTLDFTDTQRIEVLKGAAPVMYGATSFVGVVNVIHYPAGEAAEEADLAYGSYGSVRGSAALALPGSSNYRQSLVVEGRNLGFADPRESVSGGRVFYRGALDAGAGTWRLDADANLVRDTPPSPLIRIGTSLTPLTPINANFNPANAEIDENEAHLSLGYTQPIAFGTWDTLVSYAWSDVTDIRGFLHPDLSGTADTQDQSRYIGDGYLDTHLSNKRGETTLVVGADALYGRGVQTTLNSNSAYTVPLDGSVLPPPTAVLPVNEIGTLDDKRIFLGQYLQVDWQPDERWDVIAGLRLNETDEHKVSSDEILPPPPPYQSKDVSQRINRLTGTLGASYRIWTDGTDATLAYADYRNAFKPAAIDFGPDYTPDLLQPEEAQSYEAGLKGAAAGGRLSWQAEAFLLDFSNLVVPTASGALANAAGERLRGLEAEARYQLGPDLAVAFNAAWHDATYTNYLFFDGTQNVDVAGNQLPLSPYLLAAVGVLYTPQRGFTATAAMRYVGRRYLDEENTAPVGGYATYDATVGYALNAWSLSLEGINLSNQRPPVTASEFGSESYYLLPARMLWVRVRYHLR